MIAAPRDFRRTLVLHRSLPGLSSRDPGLTHCLRNRGRSTPHDAVHSVGRGSPRAGSRRRQRAGDIERVGERLGRADLQRQRVVSVADLAPEGDRGLVLDEDRDGEPTTAGPHFLEQGLHGFATDSLPTAMPNDE